MIDIDHFKSFNDSFGHGIGDEVLRRIAAYLAGAVRRSDVVCRYGGEEMVVVLPDCGVEMAAAVGEKLRDGVARLDLTEARIDLPHVTVSIGVTVYPDRCAEKGALIDSADAAMYRAKRAGRNRVCLATGAGEAPPGDNVVPVGQARS
jgi:diguanylate cyclase (GGDEF)-like protein